MIYMWGCCLVVIYDGGVCSSDCVGDLCLVWLFDEDESSYDDVGVVFDFEGVLDDVRDQTIASNTIHANWISNSEKILSKQRNILVNAIDCIFLTCLFSVVFRGRP